MALAQQQNRLVEVLGRAAPQPQIDELDSIDRILNAVRMHLGMDVAFASQFTGGRRVFRDICAGGQPPAAVGDSDPLEESYCQRVVDGRLPELIRDAQEIEEAASLPVTAALPVGAHLSVPLTLSDGTVYGTFCCFSYTPDQSLNERDLHILRTFAQLASDQIESQLSAERGRAALAAGIREVISGDRLRMVYQPIYDLGTGNVVGVEALARFPDCEWRPPSDWFEEAGSVGLGVELEMAAFQSALAGLPYLPDPAYLALNLSPEAILAGQVEAILPHLPRERLVLEVTEHEAVDDYIGFARALEPLRSRALIAVDDVGAGYSGMRHILDLKPDLIKLDMSLTRDIDRDRARAALAQALVSFCAGIGSEIVAEGVETAAELARLRELGVGKAQGYHLSRPMPLMAVRQFLLGERSPFP